MNVCFSNSRSNSRHYKYYRCRRRLQPHQVMPGIFSSSGISAFILWIVQFIAIQSTLYHDSQYISWLFVLVYWILHAFCLPWTWSSWFYYFSDGVSPGCPLPHAIWHLWILIPARILVYGSTLSIDLRVSTSARVRYKTGPLNEKYNVQACQPDSTVCYYHQ